MTFLNQNIKSIFIILGDNCNLNCKYCIQKYKIENKIKNNKINSNIYSFIKRISLNQKNKIELIFYGGEPLLYFDKIQEIIKNTIFFNIKYRVITNGTLLTREIVKYFNRYNVAVTVSWDGSQSKNTRFINVFENINLKKLIFKIKNLTISTVISSKNYPYQICKEIQKLMDEYFNLDNKKIFEVNFEEILYNKFSDDLLDIDYNKIEKDIQLMIEDCFKKEDGKKYFFIEYCFLNKYLSLYKEFKKNPENFKNIGACRDGIERLELDLNGNIFPCHDSRAILANIDNIKQKEYIKNYFQYDKTKELYEKKCHKCLYYPICLSGCKMIPFKERIKYWCKMKKAIGKPILEFLNNNEI